VLNFDWCAIRLKFTHFESGRHASKPETSVYRIVEIEEGSIEVDCLDVSSIGLHDLRSRIAFVAQVPPCHLHACMAPAL
jgi:ABC-type transport system involved in Fe-S cluster assembly fused permease/ATPase subunit